MKVLLQFIKRIEKPIDTYDITIKTNAEANRNFVANGIVVHNSNGIEPSFDHSYIRNVIVQGNHTKQDIETHSYEFHEYKKLIDADATPDTLPDYFVVTDDLVPAEHIDMQAAAQEWIDSSISKTVNVPTDIPFENFKNIYLYAYEKGLKGCTTFRFNPEVFTGVLVKKDDLKKTKYRFNLKDGSTIEVSGDQYVEYEGQKHLASNLADALKNGYYKKL
jgi:ribonucleoside-diphosphate reductase alpha chain